MRTVVIVQAYVPDYREPFFDQLVRAFSAIDIRCKVLVTGETEGTQSARLDGVEGATWSQAVPGRSLEINGHLLRLSRQRRFWADADAVVFPLAGSWLDVYRALLIPRPRRPKVALWGHVAPYTTPGVGLDLRLERWQMRRADHVFAYTEKGREYALRQGVVLDQVTNLGNTLDVSSLRAAQAALTDDEVVAFQARHRLANRRVFAVLGALDAPKRIDFLRRALDDLWGRDPSARVLVAGEGLEGALLDQAESREQVIRLGRVDETVKALIGSTATVLLNPGRIGLTAVDALALRMPLVTTSTALHGPEADYLVLDETLFVTADDPVAFVQRTLSLGRRPSPATSRVPTLDEMVARFVSGVLAMLT